ncbi:hypothetical protein BOTBODRAFT_39167 [Botryobasidium botryosum FD-172 SS1]|uniref:Uncharacterized protein n=1 Tax=Botryobasidium botryosum (strain FD-172 SS1) TaxID=930990 RepID=A0A067M562_BOTB1|nr:hypothetical protein BOTBODRAFT_39167 [Botryobasidium botryosum FD-172 SS1]
MPELHLPDGRFSHYECDHINCTIAIDHPDINQTRRAPHAKCSVYGWCAPHAVACADRTELEAIDAAYITERERLRCTPLAFFPNNLPRASFLGPWDPLTQRNADEMDLTVLQTWRTNANMLYIMIDKPVRHRTTHSTLFYRGESHVGHDTRFTLFIQEQAKLLGVMSELDQLIADRQRYAITNIR